MHIAAFHQIPSVPVNPHKASLLLILLLLTACKQQATEAVATATVQLFTPVPAVSSPTLVPSPLPPTLTLTATSGPFTPFPARPAVDALKLRVGPGELFPSAAAALSDRNRDGAWQSPGRPVDSGRDHSTRSGLEFLASCSKRNKDLQNVPLKEPQNTQVVRGRLTDSTGLPISGIQFALTFGTVERTDAMTDENGDFYAFLPADLSGDWIISYVAIACTSNAFADKTCSSYRSGYTGVVQPDTRPVTLPTEATLSFEWR
jgi:hypothetical protein